MISIAMVLEAFNEPLVLREINIPALKKGQILVKLQASGICGSDVHMWKGEDPRIPLPVILGHEGVGTIVDMKGKKFTVDGGELKSGDSIIWNRGVTCGRCYFCKVLKEPSLCTDRLVYGINISCSDPPYVNGCYADHIILHPNTDIFTISESIDPAVLVSASCSGATIAHAFDTVKDSLIGQTVVVQGPGPMGVFATAFAYSLGASRIIVIGDSPNRLEICRELGATHILNILETSIDERRSMIMDITRGRGADLAVEAVGVRGVAEEGVQLLRKGGTYLSTGYAQPAGKDEIDFYRDVVNKNVRIQGVWVSDTRHTKQAVDLVSGNVEKFAKLVTHRYSLEDANEALSVMEEKKALKAVIV